jgi:hypothetical protein
MQRLLIIAVCLLCVNAVACVPSERSKAVEIPLKSIWAHEMPGTRDIRVLEKGVVSQRASLADQIGGALDFIPKGQTAGKGFAVVGTDKEALRNAHKVLVQTRKPRQSFSASADLSLVFFSHPFGQYVHLAHVEQRDKTIKISYRFVPHETKQMTAHFALIPLGKLTAGGYQVDIVRLPLEQKYVAQGFKPVDPQWESRVVCQPFSFTVAK